MKITLFVLLSLIVTGSVGWSQSVPQNLDVQSFNEKMRRTPTKTILDVRTAQEVASGTLPGAVNIDFFAPDFTKQLGRLDKTKPVFVYCAVGGRSGKATQQLQQAGFKTVYNLTGGMQAWQQAGYPTTKKTR
jgi:phage shock protein E